jgi:hypothetical protein
VTVDASRRVSSSMRLTVAEGGDSDVSPVLAARDSRCRAAAPCSLPDELAIFARVCACCSASAVVSFQ